MPPVYYYVLEKRRVHQGVATAAIWGCALCDGIISAMGGPGAGQICERCGDAITQGKFERGELMCEIRQPDDGKVAS